MKLRFALYSTLLSTVALVPYASAQDGFSITLNGGQIAGDPAVAQELRRTDEALRDADVQISYDGLQTSPRLALFVNPQSDGSALLRSELNYPAFVVRGELRVSDALGVIATYPMTPGGTASIPNLGQEGLTVVLRVFDANGRYDETGPLALDQATSTSGGEAIDMTSSRRIPLSGGQVTVSGTDVAPGASVFVMGERVTTDPSGSFLHQRILPVGTNGVDVRVNGGGQSLAIEREIAIPSSQWFYVATADLTFGVSSEDGGDWQSYDRGRLASFADGRTASGTRITASADSQDGDLEGLFTRFGERDPRSLLLRVDPRDLYPTFGDDSIVEDRTPTSGNLYLRVERDGNFVQWGDFNSDLGNDGYVLSNRTLYGLSGQWASQDQTANGDAKVQISGYAAQPDLLPQRDVLQGTGGTIYFMSQQDIASATETLLVQTRDLSTGRIISSKQLIAGQDYQINYIQGVVTLNEPLSSSGDTGLITSGTGSGTSLVLVAQYEFRPDATDIDGYAYGARAEGWVSDTLRVGVSGLKDETSTIDQTLIGADLTYRPTETSEVRLDYARSKGPGFGETLSADGGLIFENEALATGTGEAIRLDARSSWSDLGLAGAGGVALYFEERSEGFSTPQTHVTAATGDETLWGIAMDFAPKEGLSFALTYDDYQSQTGSFERIGTAEVEADISENYGLLAALETRDINTGSEVGSRTDLGLRLNYSIDEDTSVYAFGQTTIQRSGLDRNNRFGVGGETSFGNGWALSGELSDGDGGTGARLQASRSDADGSTRYVGYELEPSRSLSGVTLDGTDRGRLVFGGRETVSNSVAMFGENQFDVFGRHKSLTSAYGLDFTPNDSFSSTIAVEFGSVDDGDTTEFERQAVSVGVRYETDSWNAAARLEYRVEDGLRTGTDVSSDTLLISGDGQYKIDDDQRLVYSLDVASTESEDSPILEGNLSDIVLGYAYRPALNDRLSVLARYRYLNDQYGQIIDGSDERGPRQRSHVFSVDASYDLDERWTIGGKLGVRLSESAASESDPFTSNDAFLGVASLRYHALGKWDLLVEGRHFEAKDVEFSETSALAAAYYQINQNAQIGVGYNVGTSSDDLTDLVRDVEGLFLNIVASY